MPIHTPALQTKVPTGSEVYDMLMQKIDPELVSANIPRLDEAYASESPEDRKKRYAKYTDAFRKYDEAFVIWQTSFVSQVKGFKRDALRSAEQESREEEAAEISHLEQEIENDTAS